jgi:multiple sugar transport system substrate-binding protein
MVRIRAISILVLVVLAASCTGTGDDEGDAPSTRSVAPGEFGGTLSFMAFGDPEELVAYRELIDAFQVAEPGVTVEFIETSDRDDLIARLSTAFAGGAPPDLFLMNYRFYGQFAVKGVLESLQLYLDSSDVFRADEFYPQALSYPDEGWTWADFLRMAKALTADVDGDGVTDRYGVGMDPEVIRLAPFIWSSGAELVDDETNPTRFAVDTPTAIKAMQDFFDLHAVYGVAPGDEQLESEDTETRFLNGTLGMVFSSRRDTPSFRTITDFGWDVAALPRRGQPAGILHSDA